MLEDLWNYYLQHPEELGDVVRKRARKEGWHRVICDYVSGMTDRYAMIEHERLFS